MAPDEIQPVGGTSLGQSYGSSAGSGAGGREEAASSPRAILDQIELTEPHRAVLALLRERVLQGTRRRLELPRSSLSTVSLPPAPDGDARTFVGRLLSDQNLLAARRRDGWGRRRIAAALEDGTTDGLSETLEVLHDVGALDETSWRLVCGVLEELAHKLERVADGT